MKPHLPAVMEESFYLVRSKGNKAHILRGRPPSRSWCGKESPSGEEHLAEWKEIVNSPGFCHRCIRNVISEYPNLRPRVRE